MSFQHGLSVKRQRCCECGCLSGLYTCTSFGLHAPECRGLLSSTDDCGICVCLHTQNRRYSSPNDSRNRGYSCATEQIQVRLCEELCRCLSQKIKSQSLMLRITNLTILARTFWFEGHLNFIRLGKVDPYCVVSAGTELSKICIRRQRSEGSASRKERATGTLSPPVREKLRRPR